LKHYSQRIAKYKKVQLGTCKDTLWNSGCFVCSLAALTNKYTPEEVNNLLTNNGGYEKGCLVNSHRASDILGLKYDGKTETKPDEICIAEVKVLQIQHFVIFAPKGTVEGKYDVILDPLNNPTIWKKNPYNIVNYRLFHERKETNEIKQVDKDKLETAIKLIKEVLNS